MNKKTIMQLIRGVIFVFVLHILSVVNMVLTNERIITDTSLLFVQLILCIISLPVYFFVKGEQTKPWLYTLVSFGASVLATFLSCLVLNYAFKGWDWLIIYFTERILWADFGIILALDVIFNIVKYRKKDIYT